jgi:protein-tyrosine-phosphatase
VLSPESSAKDEQRHENEEEASLSLSFESEAQKQIADDDYKSFDIIITLGRKCHPLRAHRRRVRSS